MSPKEKCTENEVKTQTINLSDVAAALGCAEKALMKELALIGWGALMNNAERAAHSEHFNAQIDLPAKERTLCLGAHWRHVETAAKEMFPNLVGKNMKKLGERRKGYIYVLYDAQAKLCKIGRTQTEGQRQRAQMSAHSGMLVNVMNAEVEDCVAAEAMCHKRFAAHRKNGEWFDARLDVVIQYVGEELNALRIDFENLARLVQHISAVEFGDLDRARLALIEGRE